MGIWAVVVVLLLGVLGAEPATGAAPSAGAVVPAAGEAAYSTSPARATTRAKKKSRARLTASAVRQPTGHVAVQLGSNAKVVKLKYRTASGRTKVKRLKVRNQAATRLLPAGSSRLRVKAMATTKHRATGWRPVAIVAAPRAKPSPAPSPKPAARPASPPTPKPAPTPTPTSSKSGVFVSGNRLVDAAGRTVLLRGVNRAGTEYACIDGWGVFHGPTDQASVDAMKTWGINTVRIPLNSACWLDLREQFATYNAAYSGQSYRSAIAGYVDLLTRNGIYVVLDLQWSGCGTGACLANWLKPMPERGHATRFWSSVAGMFRSNPSVMFDLFNEPRDVSWSCWLSGGCTMFADNPATAYVVEGMQPMVDAVRSAGATRQPILLGGLQYANDMSGWLATLPTDPGNSLVASIHLYDFNWPCPLAVGPSGADAVSCYSAGGVSSLDELSAAHPVVFGELGQDGCATDFVDPVLEWIGQRGFGVLGWAWNVADCSQFPALISDYEGTPTALGVAFRQFYLEGTTPTGSQSSPAPSPTLPAGLPWASKPTAASSLLSRGVPAFASTGVAQDANDDSYATAWQLPDGSDGWLAFDLSAVPAAQRGQVVLTWYTQMDDGWITGDVPGGGCPAWMGRPYLRDYVVEVSAEPGGGQPPATGWREVASVAENRSLSGQHLVDLAGAGWIRVRGSGPNGVSINLDISPAPGGDGGGWLFMGDSITAAYAGHQPLPDPGGQLVAGFADLVSAGTQGRYAPVAQNNGVACSLSSNALDFIDQMLDAFHGHYVTLNFGTNDSWGGQGDPLAFYQRMEQLVGRVTARGMVPVVPTIPWSNQGGAWGTQVQRFNEQIHRLYQQHPEVVPGPDLYTLLQGRTSLFFGSMQGDLPAANRDWVHLTDQGSALVRQAWAQTALATVYAS